MLAKIETTRTWGQMWQAYIDSDVNLNQTSAAKRHQLDEAKLRYWLKGGSCKVDYLLACRRSIPSKIKADLINLLAEGDFTVVPIDREEIAKCDPVKQAIGLHGPVNEYVQEVVNAYQDGIVTPDEESRITARYQIVRTSLHVTYITVIFNRVRRVVSRAWRVA